MAYTSKHNGHSGQCHQQTNNNQKGEARDKEQNIAVANNDPRQENANISIDKKNNTTRQQSHQNWVWVNHQKTRQAGIHKMTIISPADMLATAA